MVKKVLSRVLPLVLVVIMLLAAVPFAGAAADEGEWTPYTQKVSSIAEFGNTTASRSADGVLISSDKCNYESAFSGAYFTQKVKVINEKVVIDLTDIDKMEGTDPPGWVFVTWINDTNPFPISGGDKNQTGFGLMFRVAKDKETLGVYPHSFQNGALKELDGLGTDIAWPADQRLTIEIRDNGEVYINDEEMIFLQAMKNYVTLPGEEAYLGVTLHTEPKAAPAKAGVTVVSPIGAMAAIEPPAAEQNTSTSQTTIIIIIAAVVLIGGGLALYFLKLKKR
jgi:hypothetical protein